MILVNKNTLKQNSRTNKKLYFSFEKKKCGFTKSGKSKDGSYLYIFHLFYSDQKSIYDPAHLFSSYTLHTANRKEEKKKKKTKSTYSNPGLIYSGAADGAQKCPF